MRFTKSFLLAAFIGVACAACHKPEHPGYEKMASGLFYKSYKKGTDTVHARVGDRVSLQIFFRTEKDCVLIDTRKEHRSLPVTVRASGYPGDVFDALTMLHAGDSAGFVLDSKKYFGSMKGVKPPPFIDSNSVLYFDVKVESIQNREVIAAEQKKQQEEMMKMVEQAKNDEPKLLEEYIHSHKITAKPSKTGLYVIESQKGSGPAIKSGQTVSVKYTGKFLDGQVFDSSEKSGKPFDFRVGKQEVIPGWDEAMLNMKKGSKATLIIPSALAYGDGGGRMKPYATLLFDVEIVDVK
ncbi:MAG TPA: FKBP-type peptidyl-prolyl cis-trans isomerase [Bacteroidia bacterium]|jgi:FKBP-type peptidyl-prolyl cis-trans isomerase|nr:FKBP-type peptidyl-prolyl cis-trans isomerase [Bacteroidia bacterium]